MMRSRKHEREVLTVTEVAEILGLGRGTAYEAIRRGELPAIRVCSRLLVPQDALRAFMSGEMPTNHSSLQRLKPDAPKQKRKAH